MSADAESSLATGTRKQSLRLTGRAFGDAAARTLTRMGGGLLGGRVGEGVEIMELPRTRGPAILLAGSK